MMIVRKTRKGPVSRFVDVLPIEAGDSSSIVTRDRFLSFKFLNDQITEYNRQR